MLYGLKNNIYKYYSRGMDKTPLPSPQIQKHLYISPTRSDKYWLWRRELKIQPYKGASNGPGWAYL